MILFKCGKTVLGNCMLLTLNLFYTSNRNVDNHFVFVFQASPKRLNSFERVMCPRQARASIFTLAVFFYLGELGKQDWKADAISMSFYSKLFHWRTYFVKLGAKIQKFY